MNELNVTPIAQSIAPLIGGSLVEAQTEWNDSRAYIKINDTVVTICRESYRNNRRLAIFIDIANIPQGAWCNIPKFSLPRITVSGDKTPEQIAKDIQRRVIDASKTELDKKRLAIQEWQSSKNIAHNVLDTLKANYPSLYVQPQGESREFKFFSGGGYHSFQARGAVYSDGTTITFDRIGSMPIDKAKKILDILTQL